MIGAGFFFLLGLFIGIGTMAYAFLVAVFRGIEWRGVATAYKAERDAWMVQSLENARALKRLQREEWTEEIGEV